MNHPRLTYDQIKEIREAYKPRPTLRELAEKYGVSVSIIQRALKPYWWESKKGDVK